MIRVEYDPLHGQVTQDCLAKDLATSILNRINRHYPKHFSIGQELVIKHIIIEAYERKLLSEIVFEHNGEDVVFDDLLLCGGDFLSLNDWLNSKIFSIRLLKIEEKSDKIKEKRGLK